MPRKPREDTHSYRGWLNSDSFVKRALAVVGYNLAGSLVIYGVIIAAALLLLAFAFVVNIFI
ncbi:MAG: hypothetical protein J4431_02495 [Candidatus Aenigmarchaeota archaeon]|nr:hypothetical protein [Candidatus Aenigmarchaeota archaeon]